MVGQPISSQLESTAAGSRGSQACGEGRHCAAHPKIADPVTGHLPQRAAQTRWSRVQQVGFLVQSVLGHKTTRIFSRLGTRLNTRRWDLPGRGELTGRRGQAALPAPGWAGNPPHARWLSNSAGGTAVRIAAGPALLIAGRVP